PAGDDPPTPARGGYGGGFCRNPVPGALQTTQNPLHLDPARLLGRWPAEAGLAVLWSGRPGRRRVTVGRPEGWAQPQSLDELDALWARAQRQGALLAGFISYDLGRRLEPAAAAGQPSPGPDGGGWPLLAFA